MNSVTAARATKAQMAERYEAIAKIADEIAPCTVRQVFYQCVVRGVIEKTESGYDKVQRALLDLRRQHVVEYSCIVDSSRVRYQPTTFEKPEDALNNLAQRLRLDIWRESVYRVEFWLEKLALAGVLLPITQKWNVPLYISRGFASESYLYEAATEIVAADRVTFIFLLTDHDPSGIKIEETIRARLPELVDELGGNRWDLTFARLGLTREQIEELELPSRPTKESSHSAGFEGESTELDAMHPDTLREIVEETITEFTDDDQVERIQTEERLARAGLQALDYSVLVRHAAQKPDGGAS